MSKLIFCCLFCISLNAQVGFRKVEVIKTNNEHLVCYLKNFSTQKVAQDFWYKLDKKDDLQILKVDDIKKIIVRNKIHYIIADVEIDNRSNELHRLDRQDRTREFELKKRTLVLQELVDGEAPLYMSNLDKIKKFFFVDHDGKIKQLLYKKFFWQRGPLYVGNDYAEENNFYHAQLESVVPCLDKKMKFKAPSYEKLQLISYFEKFNSGNCGKKN